MADFTYFGGNAVMVDVGEKDVTPCRAVARGVIKLGRGTLDAVKGGGTSKKGDGLGVARIAGGRKSLYYLLMVFSRKRSFKGN